MLAYKGYNIFQTYNNHITIQDSRTNKILTRVPCQKKLSDEELKEVCDTLLKK